MLIGLDGNVLVCCSFGRAFKSIHDLTLIGTHNSNAVIYVLSESLLST